MEWISWLYTGTVIAIGLFGLHLAILLALACALCWRRQRPPARLADGAECLGAEWLAAEAWPRVLVQLPIFNERYVVERLIEAAIALDYPTDRLVIQVLDDSTDDTAVLARARVAYHRAAGRRIVYRHRSVRIGFKAGALAEGLTCAEGDYVAIFDADFVPPADFLRRLIPDFLADERLGLVQARWDHLNPDQNLATRAQALAFDGYFMTEQVARSQAGLFLNFNGSAGVWRRACIEEAGGWQADTLAEDLDLSYRAQLKGWRLAYRPDVAAPAELPASILALKRQQFRWAKGSLQVLRKLGPKLLTAHIAVPRKVFGFMHIAGYLPHPLVVLSLILSLPVVLMRGRVPLNWEALGWLSLVPPLIAAWGQLRLRADWPRRLLYYPVMVVGAIGLALSNTHACWEAFTGDSGEFLRTPKFSANAAHENLYTLPLDWTVWGELILALYALATGLLAVERAPQLAPVLFLYALAFGCTAARGLWESLGVRRAKWAEEGPSSFEGK